MLDSSYRFYRTPIPSRFILRPTRPSHLFPSFFFLFSSSFSFSFRITTMTWVKESLSLSLHGVTSSRFFQIFDIECSDAFRIYTNSAIFLFLTKHVLRRLSVDSISLHFLDATLRVSIESYRTVELRMFAKAKKGGFIVIGIDSIRGFLSLGIVSFVI